jgi:LytR cell envelope-related transcriptional attenuator
MAILREQPRPRRRRIHWQTPITMVVLLGILAGGIWWGWNSLTESTAEPQCVVTTLPNNKLTPKDVVINVYNGGARSGTAADTAAALKKRGFLIGKVSNEPNDETVSALAVRGASNAAPEVKLVAMQLTQKAPIVQDGRDDHSVDLIVGAKFTTLNPRAGRSVAVPGGQACIPVRQTEAPIPPGEAPN